MLNLYKEATKVNPVVNNLSGLEVKSIIYHDLFDFPLNFSDLLKWRVGRDVLNINSHKSISNVNGYYFLDGKAGMVYKRLLHNRISTKKILIAKKYAGLLGLIPSVKMVAITGSLAMSNSTENSDIDLLIVTSKNNLWTTRLICYCVIWLTGAKTRKPNDKDQKDKLCLNMWLDESDINWIKPEQNIYTAHEIAQIVPLINKNKTYEKFLFVNKWVLKYWPNAVKIIGLKDQVKNQKDSSFLSSFLIPVEKLAFKIQYQHMKSKVSREVITSTRAFFHPQDWGKVVIERLTP